jgi:hypothetical protein
MPQDGLEREEKGEEKEATSLWAGEMGRKCIIWREGLMEAIFIRNHVVIELQRERKYSGGKIIQFFS